MKTYTQLIEEILGESSLGHQRIGRLAKSGNLSHAHLDRYVKKHVRRASGWTVGDYSPDSKGEDILLGREQVRHELRYNIHRYNQNKHKAKQHYHQDNIDKHIHKAMPDKNLKRKPYDTDWSDEDKPEREYGLPARTPSEGGHRPSSVEEGSKGYKRALRRTGPDAKQGVEDQINRQKHRAMKSIIDIESLGNRQDRLTAHRAKLKLSAMRHPDPEVRANTRNIRTDIKAKRDAIAIQALDKQRGFDKVGDKLDALFDRKKELGA